jgi:UDP-N-acetyl-D-glucosamine dehydrogenase
MNIAVVGLGYVGLPLAIEFCYENYNVYGIDLDRQKLGRISQDKFPNFTPIHKFEDYPKKFDFIFICVPTPYTKSKDPDLSHIEDASKTVGIFMNKGSMVILQSTSFPGTTMDVMVPILEEQSGLDYDKEEFDVAFIPERINPGNDINLMEIPKIVGCNRDQEWRRISNLYCDCGVKAIYRLSSPEAAEMTKLLENTFRAVNIGFINEMARLCEKMHLNIWEIIDAAATKPYGFMPFYPGPGVGGHCIPIDPYYLQMKAREYNRPLRTVTEALQANEFMPKHVMDIVYRAARKDHIQVTDHNVLFIGTTYKPNVTDKRESPYIQFIKEETNHFAMDWDPTSTDLPIEDILGEYDIAVILIKHDLHYQCIIDNVKLVVDCVGATRGLDEKGKVYLLGRGF